MTVTLSPSQQRAVEAFRDFLNDDSQHEFLISGFAGSGKSFLVEYLIQAVGREHQVARMIDPKAMMPQLYFTATTNKAAYVLGTMLHQPTSTIHRLLGLSIEINYKTGKQKLVPKNPPKNLVDSIVFVDEASMITRDLLQYIQEAAKSARRCKVVYIGDSYQLPPVKESMCPIFQTGLNPHFLTEIQRQVAGSPIIQLATQYRRMLDDHRLNWPTIVPDNNVIFHYTDKDQWFNIIRHEFAAPHMPDDLRVLAWTNERIREYNTWIRKLMGQTGDYAVNEIVQTNKPIMVGERVVATTDSMHKILTITNSHYDGVEGYSMQLHRISDHNTYQYVGNAHNLVTVFQPKNWKEATQLAASYAKNKKFKEFFRIKNEWVDLRPIHAQTVHKAQGSTYRDVFIDLTNISQNNKWQEVVRLVYVAVTRASNQVHLFGNLADRYTKQPVINTMEVYRNAARC